MKPNRYGENGTISLDGLKRLFQNVVLYRNRTVTVQRHHHQGSHAHHDHHDHNSRIQKRAEPSEKSPKTSEVSKDQDGNHSPQSEKPAAQLMASLDECLNASSILSSHGMSQDAGVTLADFSFLCPALLSQMDGGACIQHRGPAHHEERGALSQEAFDLCVAAWVGGFVSITIISLMSLLGVVLIPLMNKVFFKFLLSFLVALAVGTLSGDAFLHLIPHVSPEEDLDGVWKGLTALSGVYVMFLIEHFLTLGKMYKDKKQKVRGHLERHTVRPAERRNTKLKIDLSANHHPHSHTHSYSEEHFQQAGVATLAWMVIMGDGLHNFSDGLAIGAAFTEGLSSGLSTAVAVFCHELPHELGDFAVLLKAGMTVRQAILYNMLSAMTAYLGVVIGILIGHYAENICIWIFALTAGLFMYVALVDMVPEMLHNDAGDHGFSHCGYFLLQNTGILLGFGIMLLIAIFEHKIQLDLGY
uniref:Zinc transporter ZIP6 n=1 Tax=Cyclopterus lumpus TaxID=8103 RepID=A0A8C2WSM8_CYCLU